MRGLFSKPIHAYMEREFAHPVPTRCVHDYTTAYREPVADLEGVPRVMWNSPFKDKLVLKNLFDLAQPDPEHKAVKGMHI